MTEGVEETMEKVRKACGDDPRLWERAYLNCLTDLFELRKAFILSEQENDQMKRLADQVSRSEESAE